MRRPIFAAAICAALSALALPVSAGESLAYGGDGNHCLRFRAIIKIVAVINAVVLIFRKSVSFFSRYSIRTNRDLV